MMTSHRVLAFARTWSLESESRTQLEALRRRVVAVGVELVVIADAGVYVFDADGLVCRVDRLCGDIATSALIYRARKGDGAYLLGGKATTLVYDGTLVGAVEAVAQLVTAEELAA